MRYKWLAYGIGLFVAGFATVVARGAEADPVTTAAEHHAKGEVLYKSEWLPIDKVFKDYLAARRQLDQVEGRGDDAKDRLVEINRELAQAKTEMSAAERPIRMELGKARNRLREYNRLLKKNPPAKPKLQDFPEAPKRPAGASRNSNRYGGGNSDYGSGNSSAYDRYQDQLRLWRQQSDAIKRQNEQLSKRYQEQYAEWKAGQTEAKAEMPKLEATIKDCEAKLDAMGADLKEKQAPTLSKSKNVTEQIRAQDRSEEVLETRVENLCNALRSAPEPVRLKHGILELDERFYSEAELRAVYGKTQKEIDGARTTLKKEAEELGLPFSEEWRHPRQDRIDAIKAILDKAAAAKKEAA